MTTAASANSPELSVIVDLTTIGRDGKTFHLAPTDEERRKVAFRLGVLGVEKLEGDLALHVSNKEIRVSGNMRAQLLRECVASLEEMQETIDESFDIAFLRKTPGRPHEQRLDTGIDDLLEVHEGETIDIGELFVQQLSLAINPFPRKDGAVNLVERYGLEEEDSPFASIARDFEKNPRNQ